MMKLLRILLYSYLLLGMHYLQAQSCSDIQRQARRLYDQGSIDEALELLNKCPDQSPQFNNAEKGVKADLLWLASQIYLLKKDSQAAKISFKRMLAYRPFYNISPDDMQDVPLIRKNLWVIPKFEIAIRAGLANSTVNIIRSQKVLTSTSSGREANKKYDKFNTGTKAGISFRYKLSERWEVATGLELWSQEFSYSYNNTFSETNYEGTTIYTNGVATGLDTLSTQTYSFFYNYNHTQTMVQVVMPLTLKYYFAHTEKFMPYIEGGVYAGRLVAANRLIDYSELDKYTLVNLENNTVRESEETLRDTFDTDTRALYTNGALGYIAGIGLDFTIFKRLYCGIGARYQGNFFTHTDQALRFNSADLLYAFHDLQDDFKLRNLSVSIYWRVPITYKAFDK